MTVLPPGGFYFVPGQGDTSIRPALQQWTYRHPSWNVRLSQAEGQLRRSRAEEVATELVEDQTFLRALGVFTSSPGQAVERAVLSQWMTPSDAQLMTVALTQALKTIRNQNVPPWKRGEVLIGVVIAVVVVGLVVLAVRESRK